MKKNLSPKSRDTVLKKKKLTVSLSFLGADLHGREADGDDKVCTPVDEDRHGHGGGARALGEQLRRDHPGDGSRAHRKEHNVEEGGHNR